MVPVDTIPPPVVKTIMFANNKGRCATFSQILLTTILLPFPGTFLQSRFLLSHVYQMLRSHFQNIPNSKHTIFYAEYFLFDKEILSHLTHKASLPKNKSAVAMLPCVVCSFKAISEKHLRMHMQTSMMIV